MKQREPLMGFKLLMPGKHLILMRKRVNKIPVDELFSL